MFSLSTPIKNWPAASRKIIPALKKLGIHTLGDLLFYFPSRYDDFSNLKKISEIAIGETVTVCGKIEKIKVLRTARQKMFLTEALVGDETGKIKAVWFNQPFLARNLKVGNLLNLSGKIFHGPSSACLQNPAYENLKPKTYNLKPTIHTGGLVAVYPETRGLTSRWLRFLIKKIINLREQVADSLPQQLREKYGFPEIKQAVLARHFPRDLAEAEIARRRFDFEELLVLQLRSLKERYAFKKNNAPAITLNLEALKNFVNSLPYKLTDAQRRSIWEIVNDLSRSRPMNRLLEGDVGSGKTVVAAAAALLVAGQGMKTAFMAPTEILARQHYETLQKVLNPFGVKIGLLTGSEKKVKHDPDIVVGTHALVQKNVKFEKLGLVVVDEQHRFGVSQRARLQNQEARIKNKEINSEPLILNSKFLIPHFLSMSATPIPRTLALTIYGDLDLSLLDETPRHRKEIVTEIVEPKKRNEAYNFIREEIKKGKQIFVVCPRIEEVTSSKLQVSSIAGQQKLLLADMKAVKEEYQKLKEKIFPEFKIGMLYGKMKPKEKKEIMENFRNGETNLLVSTSVIEVGIDIPNATIMMIEGAERFGLAQLHQLRGRVGRGTEQSYCFLFPTEDGMVTQRLKAMEESRNGFELAEKDLKIRGPGDFFGTKQWGLSDSVLAALSNPQLVREVRQAAVDLVKQDPTLRSFPELLRKITAQEKTAHLE